MTNNHRMNKIIKKKKKKMNKRSFNKKINKVK